MRPLAILLSLALLPGCVGMQDTVVAKWTGLSRSDTKTLGDIVKAANKGVKVAAEDIVNASHEQSFSQASGGFEVIGGGQPPHTIVTPGADGATVTITPKGYREQVAQSDELPNDILVIVVCDLREDGVPLRCYPPQQVLRNEWPGFWRAMGGDKKYPNGRPTRKFTTHKVIKANDVTSSQDDPDDVFVLLVDGYRTERLKRSELAAFFLANPNSAVKLLDMIRAKSVLVPPNADSKINVVPTVATYPTSLPVPVGPGLLKRTDSLEKWARTEIGRFENYDWQNAPTQTSYMASCPCGCNGNCGGNCGCANCTCASYAGYQSGGCATCGVSAGQGVFRSGPFMQRGPLRRALSAPFRGGWFPGRGVFRFFKNGGLFRRGGCC